MNPFSYNYFVRSASARCEYDKKVRRIPPVTMPITIPMRVIWKLARVVPCVKARTNRLDPNTNQFASIHNRAFSRLGLGMIVFKTCHCIGPIRKPPQNKSSILNQTLTVDGWEKGNSCSPWSSQTIDGMEMLTTKPIRKASAY